MVLASFSTRLLLFINLIFKVDQEFHVIEESCPSSTISADTNMVSNSQLRVSYMSFAFVSSDAMEHEEELTCSVREKYSIPFSVILKFLSTVSC